jgi:hypothetical protein
MVIANDSHEKGIADNQPNLEVLHEMVKLGNEAFLFEKMNGRPTLVYVLE